MEEMSDLPKELSGKDIVRILQSNGYLRLNEVGLRLGIPITTVSSRLRILTSKKDIVLTLVEYLRVPEQERPHRFVSEEESELFRLVRPGRIPIVENINRNETYSWFRLSKALGLRYDGLNKYVKQGLPFEGSSNNGKKGCVFEGSRVIEYFRWRNSLRTISAASQETRMPPIWIRELIDEGRIRVVRLGKREVTYIEKDQVRRIDAIARSSSQQGGARFKYLILKAEMEEGVLREARSFMSRRHGSCYDKHSGPQMLKVFLADRQLRRDTRLRSWERIMYLNLTEEERQAVKAECGVPLLKKVTGRKLPPDVLEQRFSTAIERMYSCSFSVSYLDKLLEKNEPSRVMRKAILFVSKYKMGSHLNELFVIDFFLNYQLFEGNRYDWILKRKMLSNLDEDEREMIHDWNEGLQQGGTMQDAINMRRNYTDVLKRLLDVKDTYHFISSVLDRFEGACRG